MYRLLLLVIIFQFISSSLWAQNLGNYSANPYAPNSTSNPYGAESPYNKIVSIIPTVPMAVHIAINQVIILTQPMHPNYMIKTEIIMGV